MDPTTLTPALARRPRHLARLAVVWVVAGLFGTVLVGEADAGFVYVSDARVAASRLKTIAIPVFAQPKVRYEIAVVRNRPGTAAARAYVAKVTGPAGRRRLAQAGFRFPVPPKPRPRARR
jgi:ABC-type molybdate transport system substrate-binding protein